MLSTDLIDGLLQIWVLLIRHIRLRKGCPLCSSILHQQAQPSAQAAS